MKFVLRSK